MRRPIGARHGDGGPADDDAAAEGQGENHAVPASQADMEAALGGGGDDGHPGRGRKLRHAGRRDLGRPPRAVRGDGDVAAVPQQKQHIAQAGGAALGR